MCRAEKHRKMSQSNLPAMCMVMLKTPRPSPPSLCCEVLEDGLATMGWLRMDPRDFHLLPCTWGCRCWWRWWCWGCCSRIRTETAKEKDNHSFCKAHGLGDDGKQLDTAGTLPKRPCCHPRSSKPSLTHIWLQAYSSCPGTPGLGPCLPHWPCNTLCCWMGQHTRLTPAVAFQAMHGTGMTTK